MIQDGNLRHLSQRAACDHILIATYFLTDKLFIMYKSTSRLLQCCHDYDEDKLTIT